MVARRLFDVDTPRWQIVESIENITVEDGGSCVVEREFELTAGDESAQVWKIEITADDTAEPVRYIGLLDFTLECVGEDDHEICYMVTKNQWRYKEITVFFLPEIRRGETRKIKLSYTWDGFARDLIKYDRTTFILQYKSANTDQVCRVSATLKFKDTLGDVGIKLENSDIGANPQRRQVDGYTIYHYENDAFSLKNSALSMVAERTAQST